MVKRLPAPASLAGRLPPRVEVPAALSDAQAADGRWRWRIEHLFSAQFSTFMDWLVGTFPATAASMVDDGVDTGAAGAVSVKRLATIAAQYLLRLLLADPAAGTKIHVFLQWLAVPRLESADRAIFDLHLLRELVKEPKYLAWVWRAEDASYRASMSRMLHDRMMELKAEGDPRYPDILNSVIHAHASHLRELGLIWDRWREYFDFVTLIASQGLAETKAILDAGYLRAVWEVVFIEAMPSDVKKAQHVIWGRTRTNGINLTSPFSFLYGILNEHVNLEKTDGYNDGPYATVDGLLLLKANDLSWLRHVHVVDGAPLWSLAWVASTRCPIREDGPWVDWPPGKLFGLVAERASPAALVDLQKTLVARWRDERYLLLPILSMALHYLQAVGEGGREVLKYMSKDVADWLHAAFGPQILDFYSRVAKLAPNATAECAGDWAPTFLRDKKALLRRGAIEHLAENVFVELALADTVGSAVRIRVSRHLAAKCLPTLRHAGRLASRPHVLTETQAAMEMLERWLSATHDALRGVLADEERREALKLGAELLV
ncbi:hypothetical protein LTR53_017929, partial [Teratosphaeriaceae sp. CCFEE 6253]